MACELQFQISQNDQRVQLCPELRWKWDTPIPNDNIQSTAKATSNLESIDQCWSEIHCIALLPWIMVFRMQMQSLMFFFWGGDFHARVLSFLEPATSACSWHVKTHSSSKLIGTTSETIRNAAEPHRADNYWILLITGSWYFRMVHAANGTPKHESQLCQLFSLLCSIAGTYTKKTSWHVMQGRVKPKHDSCTTRLSWPARTWAYDRQGNNGGIDARLNTWKEHEGTNCTQWISMIYDWLILAACFCLLLLDANVQHLRAQKYGSSQKSHSYRLVSPASRNRDNASSWTDPWHEQGFLAATMPAGHHDYDCSSAHHDCSRAPLGILQEVHTNCSNYCHSVAPPTKDDPSTTRHNTPWAEAYWKHDPYWYRGTPYSTISGCTAPLSLWISMATGSTLRWESRPQQLCCLEANWDCTLNSDGHTGWLPNNGQLHQLRNFAWKCGSVIRRVNFRWLQRFLWASDKSDPGKRPALSLQKIRIPSSAITASSLSSCYWHHGLEILAMEDRSISLRSCWQCLTCRRLNFSNLPNGYGYGHPSSKKFGCTSTCCCNHTHIS